MGTALMAKKRAKKPARMVFGMRGSEEWKTWLDDFANERGLKTVELVGRALEEYAEKYGFRRPPKR